MRLDTEATYYGIDGEPIIKITNQRMEKIEEEYFIIRDQWTDPTFDRLSNEAGVMVMRIRNLWGVE